MNVTETDQAQRLAMRVAGADFISHLRQLVGAATRMQVASIAWDPKGEREDVVMLGVAETSGALLALLCRTAPGFRMLLEQAVLDSLPAPAEPPVDPLPPAPPATAAPAAVDDTRTDGGCNEETGDGAEETRTQSVGAEG